LSLRRSNCEGQGIEKERKKGMRRNMNRKKGRNKNNYKDEEGEEM
jgi:hypothetical protein